MFADRGRLPADDRADGSAPKGDGRDMCWDVTAASRDAVARGVGRRRELDRKRCALGQPAE